MNRTSLQPVILPMYPVAPTPVESPTVPFPRGRSPRRERVRRRTDRRPRDDNRDSPIGQMRERLLKMIVANEWDRTHGNRAS